MSGSFVMNIQGARDQRHDGQGPGVTAWWQYLCGQLLLLIIVFSASIRVQDSAVSGRVKHDILSEYLDSVMDGLSPEFKPQVLLRGLT